MIGDIDVEPEDQNSTVLLEAESPARFVPSTWGADGPSSSGHLLFVRGNSLYAQPFDADAGALQGDPRMVFSGVGDINVSSSPTGTLAYRAYASGWNSSLRRFDRSGRVLSEIGPPGYYVAVDLSPRDDRLIIGQRDPDGGPQTFVVDLARGVFSRLNLGGPGNYGGVASPDGTVTFTYSPEGVAKDLYDRPTNGAGAPTLIYSSDTLKHAHDWSPDGRWLIFDDHRRGMAQDLFVIGREGGEPVSFLVGTADDTLGRFSSDGRWVLYRSDESGRSEVYVRDFPPDRVPAHGDEKIQISSEGGDKPRFSRDGREIYYVDPSGWLTAVSVGLGDSIEVGIPEPLFQVEMGLGYVPFDVLPNGDFIINALLETSSESAPIIVVTNWQSILERP